MKIQRFTPGSSLYPDSLREIAHPPKQLYKYGELRTDMPLVAIVGTRKATSYGRDMAHKLAGELARNGIGIVSGLALGIDAEAHRAVLQSGGYAVAVLGCGPDKVHPLRHRDLAEAIIDNGGVLISEYEPGTPPLKHHFPARNRIVSGLCQATLVIEAAEQSGALITAGFALEQNRDVLAVPGNTTNPQSRGTNQLIRNGAGLVTSADDVLMALGYAPTDPQPSAAASATEAAILEILRETSADSATIIERSGLDTATLNQTLTLMEINGKIRRIQGDTWVLC